MNRSRRRCSNTYLGLSFLGLPILSSAFHCSRRQTTDRSIAVRINEATEDSKSKNHRWRQTPFDFSSKQGWEDFYKNGQSPDHDGTKNIADVSSLEYEWHNHIPHSAIIEMIAPSIEAAIHQSSYSNNGRMPSILIVGCGNSSLPRVLHDAFSHPVRITCLDYSTVCIDMIKQMYGKLCPNLDFVVGDAMKMQEVIEKHSSSLNSTTQDHLYDVVIDKGLMDAMMCGDGFDVETLQRGVDSVLTPSDWGMHVLICFPLIKGMKENLVELGQRDTERCLFWSFDLPVEGSQNGRASFNVGKRSLWKFMPDVDRLQTSWN
jgi:hypothetical protein